ncbi:MAG: hypothetical protein WAO00_14260, partial [Chthoniobacterales bacterium]
SIAATLIGGAALLVMASLIIGNGHRITASVRASTVPSAAERQTRQSSAYHGCVAETPGARTI